MTLLTEHVLITGAILFIMGLLGFLTRRSMILMFLSLELMLAGVSVNFIAFSRHHDNYQGQVFVIFVLTVAACEAAIGLALIVALLRRKPTLDIRVWHDLGEVKPEEDSRERAELPFEHSDMTFPKLTPAGNDPTVKPALGHASSSNGEATPRPGSHKEVITHA